MISFVCLELVLLPQERNEPSIKFAVPRKSALVVSLDT